MRDPTVYPFRCDDKEYMYLSHNAQSYMHVLRSALFLPIVLTSGSPGFAASRLLWEAQCPMSKMRLREFGKEFGEDALFYPSDAAFDADLPEGLTKNIYSLSQYLSRPYEQSKRLRDLVQGGMLQIGTCTTTTQTGAIWYTQRIGPFMSTGGSDWWAAGWTNLAGMHREDGAGVEQGITAHVAGAVSSSGELIPYPPIHMHHTSCSLTESPAGKNLAFSTHPIFLDVSGDAQCEASASMQDPANATECLGSGAGPMWNVTTNCSAMHRAVLTIPRPGRLWCLHLARAPTSRLLLRVQGW